ncbi:MAG: 50S ribosomal protein L29 [Acidobacteriota bacterium]
MMKASKIRELDANEVAAQIKEQQEQAFRLRLQLGMGQAEGLKKYRSLRKDRARLLTITRERELAKAK